MSDHFERRDWQGWLRVGRGRWQAVASGPSEGLCRMRLDELARRHQHADTAVLMYGTDPNVKVRG